VETHDPVLSAAERAFLGGARRAVLATIAGDGGPRLVPVCFVLDPDRPVIYTPLDEKPKTVDDPRGLARVRDILADPRVTILVDRWDEDWANLAWLRLAGTATLLEGGGGQDGEHSTAVGALRARYAQYRAHRLETRPLIRVAVDHVASWGPLDAY
jgi:PPOX class probable F420-dependent enzyme